MMRRHTAIAVVAALMLAANSTTPVAARTPAESVPVAAASPAGVPVTGTVAGVTGSVGAAVASTTANHAPSLGDGFVLLGEGIAAGVVGLDWPDVGGATGYELQYRSSTGWLRLSSSNAARAVSAVFDGTSAVVAGLPEDQEFHRFSVRARSVWGVSEWSPSVEVTAFRVEQLEPPFDPFTAPTLSDIDLDRLANAAATVAPGLVECSSLPPLSVAGLRLVNAPADINDPDAPLTVAEVARIVAGCLIVEHVALDGRSVAQVRALLAGHPNVHAVGAPMRGFEPAHISSRSAHAKEPEAGHHDDGAGPLWHITPEVRALWDGWDSSVPVTVAVLDSGVATGHRDLRGQIVANGPGGCHEIDAGSHGTHVAGIIAAEHHPAGGNVDVAGVAPQAKILPLRVLQTDSCAATPKPMTPPQAVAHAVNEGARVINMSFIGPPEKDEDDISVKGVGIPSTDTYELVMRAASMLGVALVAAAGNCGNKNSYVANHCTEHNQRRAPAIFPDVIAVASHDHTPDEPLHGALRSSFSTANDDVDVSAPGERILSTVPIVTCEAYDDDNDNSIDRWEPLLCGTLDPAVACGPSVAPRTSVTQVPWACSHATALQSGTSMAAPFVAGVAAHLINRYPDATPGQVRAAIEESALEPQDPSTRWRTRDRGDGTLTDDKLEKRLSLEKKHLPTKEYGRGIVNPAGVLAELRESFRQLRPSGTASLFVEVSAGARHGCGRLVNGAVKCWGDPVVVDATPSHRFTSLTSPPKGRFVCGIRGGDGVAQCWGQLPSSLTSPVVTAFGASALPGKFKQIAAGDRHVCGIRPNDSVVCWGDDSLGRTDVPLSGFADDPRRVVTSIYSGSEHSCALLDTGQLTCWGATDKGRDPGLLSVPVIDVALGRAFTCVLLLDGTVSCSGDIADGPATGPGESYTAVSAGADHACAQLAVSRQVRCWGRGGDKRLEAPAGAFLQVSAGGSHSCGLAAGLRVRCWGSDAFGQAPADARLSALRVRSGGVDLLAGQFRPDVFEYAITADSGQLAVLARADTDDDASSRIVTSGGPRGPNTQKALVDGVTVSPGLVIEVTVGAIFGMGERRTYRVRVVERPSLRSLRLVPDGSGPHCVPQCAALALSPSFDPKVTSYRATAGRDVKQVSVWHLARAGVAAVSPGDVSSAAGHQVELGSDSGFVSVSAGFEEACGLGSDGAIRCWGDNALSQSDPPAGTFASVSTGGWHSCAIGTDKTVECWGYDQGGRTDAPSGTFSSVSAGRWHTCGVRTTGAAACWGYDAQDQASPPAGSFSSVSSGAWHSCGVKADKSVACWGSNLDGQSTAPSGTFSSVSAGLEHACGVKTDKTVACWGLNDSGQATAPSGSFTSVSAARTHTCGVKTDKTVVCWGSDVYGQSTAPSGTFAAVSTGDQYSCGLRTNGRVECWGYDQSGRLAPPAGSLGSMSVGIFHNCGVKTDSTAVCWGLNSHGQATAPSGAFSSVAAGWRHSCGVKADRSVACWGNNTYGQAATPSGSFTSVSASVVHSCGVKTDRTVVCWGNNSFGQTSAPSGSFISVSAGAQHTCGVKTDNTVACWGDNANGEATVPAGAFSSVAAGTGFTCGLKTDQTLACWGSNDSTRAEPPTGAFSSVTAGWYHACGIRTDGTAVCWGRNGYGQADAPAGSFSSIGAGINHSCGIVTGRGAQCWGERLLALDPAPPVVVTVTVTSHIDPSEQTRYQVAISRPAAPNSGAPVQGAGGAGGASHSGGSDGSGVGLPLGCVATGDCDTAATACAPDSERCAPTNVSGASAVQPGSAGGAVGKLAAISVSGGAGAAGVSGAAGSQQASSPAAAAWTGACPAPDLTETEGAERVVFADAVLRRAVAAALDKAPDATVTRAELAGLASLAVAAPSDDAPRLSGLAGLEYAVNLTALDIRSHDLADLGPVGCLRRLAHLELGSNQITDIGPLRSLDDLQTLGLSSNRIADIGLLAKLTGLRAVDLSHNRITSLSPLAGISGLVALNAGGNQISDVAPVAGLGSLRTLLLYDNKIADIGPLAKLTALRTLMVDHNQITSLDATVPMIELRTLGAAGNNVVHVWPLVWKHRLERLYLSDNQIVHPFALTTLGALRTLWIDGNQIDNPWQLRGVNPLGYLDIRHNRIADTTILGALAQTAHTEPQDT